MILVYIVGFSHQNIVLIHSSVGICGDDVYIEINL